MELALSWTELGRNRSYTITSDRHSLRPVKIGRDPLRVELVINNPTVSGLQAQIHYDPTTKQFLIESLRETNPVLVDGQKLTQGAKPLKDKGRLQMGNLTIKWVVQQPTTTNPVVQYGLKCPNPKCGKISPYDSLKLVCPWCGTSLASAQSMILPHDH
jgi:predicted component of type VI protein secretion system